MGMLTRLSVALLVVLALALGVWWYNQRQIEEADDTLPVIAPVEEPVPPPVRFPVPESESGPVEAEPGPRPDPRPPLPPLEDSDQDILEVLSETFDDEALETWLVPERIVERTVLFIHSLDGPAIPLRLRPGQHVPGLPAISEDDDTLIWNPANAARYRSLVEVMQATDIEALTELYFSYYPLFQEAYAELGTSDVYFNDRLVDVIDHLLGAPRVPAEFEVERPEVLYQFADPALEAESWGRKILMRMGPDNAEAVKAWLRELREQVSGAPEAER